MYIVLSKTTTQTAVIRDATELAGYLNTTPSRVRRNTEKGNRWEFKDYIIIIPDYIQIKSNSGGKRTKKEVNNDQNEWNDSF